MASTANTDRELIQKALTGDSDGHTGLYTAHFGRIVNVLTTLTKNREDAEDLAQEAFTLAFRALPRFRADSRFSTWIHRIAVNTFLMTKRKRYVPVIMSLDDHADTNIMEFRNEYGSMDLAMEMLPERQLIMEALDKLPDGQKKIFILHCIEGYEHHQIAKMHGLSIGTSKSQLCKAKQRMRKAMTRMMVKKMMVKRPMFRHPDISLFDSP
jgi:RNA polymerase sigma-70 factor (ECF subfamily)